jgi:hypothetical protein
VIKLQDNLRLNSILSDGNTFPLGVELVSMCGTMGEKQALKARGFTEDLTHSPQVS